jgi:hypothetical protein
MPNNQRNLVISISEIFDIPVDSASEVNRNFKGTLPPMPTALSVTYDRKTAGGLKCDEPLNPVYMEALIEALAYLASLSANQPDQVPLLAGLMLGRLSQRVQVYGKAKFPDFISTLRGGLAGVLAKPEEYSDKRDMFLEYFSKQLGGIKEPCKECTEKDCKFKGTFDVPKVTTPAKKRRLRRKEVTK